MKIRLAPVLVATASLGLAQFTPTAPVAPASSANPVVAVVAGKQVTLNDVKEMMVNAPPSFQQAFKQNPQLAISQYFLVKHLAAEGDKAQLDRQSPLKEQLEMLRANAVAVAMVNHERDGYNVSTKMIQDFYDSHRARYEQANVKLLYLAFKPGAPADSKPKSAADAAKEAFEAAHPKNERSEEEARKLAEDLVKQLKGGAKFTDLVAKHSDDATSKAAGGDFGPVKSTSPYPDDVKKAIFALEAGQISDPIRQSNGYYLIQMQSKTAQPLNEVAESIVQEIRQAHLDEWLKNLNDQFKAEVKNQEFFLKPDQFLK